MKQVFLQLPTFVSSSTVYCHPQVRCYGGYSTNERDAQLHLGDNGTIWDLNVHVDENYSVGAGETWTVTVNVNGVNSALTVTLSEGETSKRSSASAVAITAGDKISYEVTSTGTPSAIIANTSLEYSSNTAGYSMISGGHRDQTTTTIYDAFGCFNATNNTVEDTQYHRINSLFSFTIRSVYLVCGTAPGGAAQRGFDLEKGGAVVGSYYVTGANTESSYTGLNISISQGDDLGCVFKEVSGPANSDFMYAVLIEAGTDGMSWINTTPMPDVSTSRPGFFGYSTSANTERKYYCGTTGFTLKNLYQVSDGLGAGADRDATVYKNGSPTALTCNIPGSSDAANDTSNSVAYADGDYADIKIVTTNDTEQGAVACAMYIPAATPKGLPLLYAG